MAAYRQAAILDPRQAEARYNLGVMLFNRGETDAAEAQFAAAARVRPDFAEARDALSRVQAASASRSP